LDFYHDHHQKKLPFGKLRLPKKITGLNTGNVHLQIGGFSIVLYLRNRKNFNAALLLKHKHLRTKSTQPPPKEIFRKLIFLIVDFVEDNH